MKKLALFIALAMILSLFSFVACTTSEGNTTTDDNGGENEGDKVTTTTTTARTVDQTPDTGDDDDDDGDDDEGEALADASKFTVDGDLSEWSEFHNVKVIGEASDTKYNSGSKSATFWAAYTEDGIYVACEAYHDRYNYGNATWWLNTNFEIFIGSGDYQYYIYGQELGQTAGTSTNVDEAVMVTEELTDGATNYHSKVEAFISNDNITAEAYLNTIEIGMGWKTAGDLIIGGGCNATDASVGADEYWIPVDAWPASCRLIVAPSGLFFPDDYYEE